MPNFKARPTLYKGIQMRSRLEAGFAGWLDRSGITWQYEPHAVGDEHGQYLPDFLVADGFIWCDTGDVVDIYVEVKPTVDVVDWAKMRRAAAQLQESTNTMLAVVTPGGAWLIYPAQLSAVEGGPMAAPLVWVDASPSSGDLRASARLTIQAFSPPFEGEWWS